MSQAVTAALAVTAEVTGTRLSDMAVKVMLRALAEHPEPAVLAALERCQTEVRHRLTLADIIARLPTTTPSADAAWELAMREEVWDENKTLVLPKAILSAFPFALWAQGDRVAARMAFKDAYPRALTEHGDATYVSLGHDERQREDAIRDAHAKGLLTADQAQHYLPHVAGQALQLEGPPVERGMPENVKAKVREILGTDVFKPVDELRRSTPHPRKPPSRT